MEYDEIHPIPSDGVAIQYNGTYRLNNYYFATLFFLITFHYFFSCVFLLCFLVHLSQHMYPSISQNLVAFRLVA
jgi:hypothetical protein